MTIADHLLTRLVESGVRHVFGAPCADNQRLLDVIDAHPDLEWVGSASQLSAAYAADGYARMHGLAAVVTTYSSSARDGIAESFAESVPVLVIAGTPAQPHGSGSPGDRSPSDGDAGDLARAFGAVTCASALLAAGDATAEIDRVLECMLADMRPGYLGVPADLVGAHVPAHRSGARACGPGPGARR